MISVWWEKRRPCTSATAPPSSGPTPSRAGGIWPTRPVFPTRQPRVDDCLLAAPAQRERPAPDHGGPRDDGGACWASPVLRGAPSARRDRVPAARLGHRPALRAARPSRLRGRHRRGGDRGDAGGASQPCGAPPRRDGRRLHGAPRPFPRELAGAPHAEDARAAGGVGARGDFGRGLEYVVRRARSRRLPRARPPAAAPDRGARGRHPPVAHPRRAAQRPEGSIRPALNWFAAAKAQLAERALRGGGHGGRARPARARRREAVGRRQRGPVVGAQISFRAGDRMCGWSAGWTPHGTTSRWASCSRSRPSATPMRSGRACSTSGPATTSTSSGSPTATSRSRGRRWSCATRATCTRALNWRRAGKHGRAPRRAAASGRRAAAASCRSPGN